MNQTFSQEAQAERRVRRSLVFLGGLLWLALAFFWFVLPRTPARMIRRSAELAADLAWWQWLEGLSLPVPDKPTALAIWLVVFGGAAFLIYGVAILLTWRRAGSPRTVATTFGLSALLLLTSVVALPNFNTDIFNYIAQGRLMTAHASNPHYVAVEEFPNDPVFPYAGRKYTKIPNDYLPAWSLFNVSLSRLGGNDPTRLLLTYRFAFFLLSLGNLLFIMAILRKLAPERVLTGLIVYSWHPIVALEGSSRVDILMAFLLLVSVYCLVQGRRVFSIVALTLSAFTKWITLPLLTMQFLDSTWTGRWRRLGVDLVVCLVTVALIYVPFTTDTRIFKEHLDMLLRGGASAPKEIQTALLVGFSLMVLILSRRHQGDVEGRLTTWAVTMLVFVAFMSKIGYGWYVISPMALVCLVSDGRVVSVAGSLGVAALAFQWRDTAFTDAFPMPNLLTPHRFWIFLAVAVIVGLFCFLMLRQARGFALRYLGGSPSR